MRWIRLVAFVATLLGSAASLQLEYPDEIRSGPYLSLSAYQGTCGWTHDGLGFVLIKLIPLFDAAERYSMTYVCQPGQFRGGHNVGCVGRLFGCVNSTYAIGKAVAYEDVMGDPRRPRVNVDFSQGVDGFDVVLRAGSSLWRPSATTRGTICIYDGSAQLGRIRGHPIGLAWRWFRDQYHLVRELDPARKKPECWQHIENAAQKRKIAIAIRRGDDNGRRGFPVHMYGQLLDAVLNGSIQTPRRTAGKKTELIIVAETPENDPEMRAFEKYRQTDLSVTYLLGNATLSPRSAVQARLIRDIDCMVTSDVLIASGGTFSYILRALMNTHGMSITIGKSSDEFPKPQRKAEDIAEAVRFRSSVSESISLSDDIPNSFWAAVE